MVIEIQTAIEEMLMGLSGMDIIPKRIFLNDRDKEYNDILMVLDEDKYLNGFPQIYNIASEIEKQYPIFYIDFKFMGAKIEDLNMDLLECDGYKLVEI